MHGKTAAVLVRAGLVATFATLAASAARGDFIDPVEVSAATGVNSRPQIARSITDAISIAYERDGQVYFASSLIGFGTEVHVTEDGTENGPPAIAAGSLGLSYLIYEQEDPSATGLRGSGIILADNNGGPFKNFLTLVDSDDDEREPVLVYGSTGTVDVAWTRVPELGERDVEFSRDLGPAVTVAEGASPAIAGSSDGAVHIVYLRGGDVYYRRFVDDAFEDEVPLSSLAGDEQGAVVHVDGAGIVHVAFLSANAIYYLNNEGGSFGEPEVEVSGPVAAPVSLASGEGDRLVLAYAESGQIEYLEREDGIFGGATSATPESDAASAPAVTIDSYGWLHFAFEEDGAIYYTTDTPAPVANFTGDLLSGEIPLDVNFTNTSSGIYGKSEWTFGDGTTSLAQNPSHSYVTTGKKTVTLKVTGPGGVSTKSRFNYIDCLAPTNILSLPTIHAFGGLAVTQPVYATHTEPLQGFLLRLRYDEALTPISDIRFTASVTDPLDPEFIIEDNEPDGENSILLVSVILDINDPFDGRTIAPGTNQILLSLEYQVPIGVSIGDKGEIRFEDSGLNKNHFDANFEDIGTVSVEPFLSHGVIEITTVPTVTFLRGDTNLTGGIDLSDAIFALAWMFSNGPDPLCLDAADFNDSGAIDIADAIGSLNFQFAGGPPPLYPYPAPGLDGTADTLAECDP